MTVPFPVPAAVYDFGNEAAFRNLVSQAIEAGSNTAVRRPVLKDANSVLWGVGVDTSGRIVTVSGVTGREHSPTFKDSAGVTWTMGVTTSGALTMTS